MTILLNALVGGVMPEYTDPETKTVFTGSTWAEILSALQKFLSDQGRDPSLAVTQLLKYVCEKYPQQCIQTEGPAMPEIFGGITTILYSSEFILNTLRKEKIKVSSEVQQQRLAVCEKCVYRRLLSTSSGCGSCQERFMKQVTEALHVSSTPYACVNLGALVEVLAQIPSKEFLAKFGGNWRDLLIYLPGNCWFVKEDEKTS